jgi:hypothetical protein
MYVLYVPGHPYQYTAAGEIHTMRNARCIRKRSEIRLRLLHIRKPSALVAF